MYVCMYTVYIYAVIFLALTDPTVLVTGVDLQLARHRKALQQSLKPGLDPDDEREEALRFYAKHTAQIEVYILLRHCFNPNKAALYWFLSHQFIDVNYYNWISFCSDLYIKGLKYVSLFCSRLCVMTALWSRLCSRFPTSVST